MSKVLTVLNHGSESYTAKKTSTFFSSAVQPELITIIEQLFLWDADPQRDHSNLSKIRSASPVRELSIKSKFLVTQGQGTSGILNPDRNSMISAADLDSPGFKGESEGTLKVHSMFSAKKQMNPMGGLNPLGFKVMSKVKLGATADTGVYNNVDRLVQHIEKCSSGGRETLHSIDGIYEDTEITQINMVGWSRGAVTSIRQANYLSKEFPDIKINIFSVDPVAGLGQDTDDGPYSSNILPDNVEEYIIIFAGNEDRFAFPPLPLPKNLSGTTPRYVYLPFPGDHSNVAKKDNDSGAIIAHICCKFLIAHGSLADKSSPLKNEMLQALVKTQSELLTSYDNLLSSISGGSNKGHIQVNHGSQTTIMSAVTSSDTGRGASPFSGKFFINQHHKEVFLSNSGCKQVYDHLCGLDGTDLQARLTHEDLKILSLLGGLVEHKKRITSMLSYKTRSEIRDIMDDTSSTRKTDIDNLGNIMNKIKDLEHAL